MKLILIEDDPLQAEWMMRGLTRDLASELELIPNERGFCERLAAIEKSPPDLFVIDVILPWTEPHPKSTPPPREVREGGRERAGFRCRQRLTERPALREVPVILYSFLDDAHFPQEILGLPLSSVYLRKEAELSPLYEEIRRLLGGTVHRI